MGYVDGFSLDSLHTLRITQKSAPHPCQLMIRTLSVARTLIATIKDFGTCPCPRCLVTIDQISSLGREDDRERRERSLRLDNADRRKNVSDARKSLYDEGYAISGDRVGGVLKEESRVPTEVLMLVFAMFTLLTHAARVECILSCTFPLWV